MNEKYSRGINGFNGDRNWGIHGWLTTGFHPEVGGGKAKFNPNAGNLGCGTNMGDPDPNTDSGILPSSHSPSSSIKSSSNSDSLSQSSSKVALLYFDTMPKCYIALSKVKCEIH